MAVSIFKLVTTLDKDDVLADVYTLLGRAFGQPLELDPGSPVAGILDTFVEWAVDEVWNPIVVPAIQAPFLDYATGDWLSLVADLIYNRPRIDKQAGTQTVTFENRSTLGAVTQAAGTVRIKAVIGNAVGKTYTTTTPLSIAAWSGTGPFPTGDAVVEADIAGTVSNALNTDIGTFATGTPLVLGPVNCFVKTVAGNIFGTDEETDANLVIRCRLAVSEASDMGPRAEYTSIALDPVGSFTRRNKTPPSGWGTLRPAISRVAVLEPGNAHVLVYLASSSGPAAGNQSLPLTDVGKVAVALLSFVVPPGTTCIVAAATNHQVITLTAITLYISASSNVTSVAAIATAVAGLTKFFSTLPIGGSKTTPGGTGYVFAAAVINACWGPGIVDVDLNGFTDDALLDTDVATFAVTPSLFTPHIVSQGD